MCEFGDFGIRLMNIFRRIVTLLGNFFIEKNAFINHAKDLPNYNLNIKQFLDCKSYFLTLKIESCIFLNRSELVFN